MTRSVGELGFIQDFTGNTLCSMMVHDYEWLLVNDYEWLMANDYQWLMDDNG